MSIVSPNCCAVIDDNGSTKVFLAHSFIKLTLMIDNKEVSSKKLKISSLISIAAQRTRSLHVHEA